jgi:hypothetical protein
MAGQVGMLAQARIHVGRQHLAVGCRHDLGAFDLAQQVLKVQHVVAG